MAKQKKKTWWKNIVAILFGTILLLWTGSLVISCLFYDVFDAGFNNVNIKYAKEIPLVQDKNGNNIQTPVFELVSAGKNNTSLMDTYGLVYSVGLNTYGQLGMGDNITRRLFTRIGETAISMEPEVINVTIGTTKNIKLLTQNAFNLKTDVATNGDIELYNANDKILTISKIEDMEEQLNEL